MTLVGIEEQDWGCRIRACKGKVRGVLLRAVDLRGQPETVFTVLLQSCKCWKIYWIGKHERKSVSVGSFLISLFTWSRLLTVTLLSVLEVRVTITALFAMACSPWEFSLIKEKWMTFASCSTDLELGPEIMETYFGADVITGLLPPKAFCWMELQLEPFGIFTPWLSATGLPSWLGTVASWLVLI